MAARRKDDEPITCKGCRYCQRGYCTVRAVILGDTSKPHYCPQYREKQW